MKYVIALSLLLFPFLCLAQEVSEKEVILSEVITVKVENDGFITHNNDYFEKGDSCLIDKGSKLSLVKTKEDSVKVKTKKKISLLAYCPAGTEFFLTKDYFLKIVEKGRIE